MKKISLLFLIICTFFISCKKNYTCVCKSSSSFTDLYYFGELQMEGYSNDTGTTRNYIKQRKNKAESTCNANEYEMKSSLALGIGYSGGELIEKRDCELE